MTYGIDSISDISTIVAPIHRCTGYEDTTLTNLLPLLVGLCGLPVLLRRLCELADVLWVCANSQQTQCGCAIIGRNCV
jgi:hypothetical protein